jgi:hypothetical protein
MNAEAPATWFRFAVRAYGHPDIGRFEGMLLPSRKRPDTVGEIIGWRELYTYAGNWHG